MKHPCLSCGACCAAFRVAFHWSESDHFSHGRTPAGLTEKLDPHRSVMRGTQARKPRCVALLGDIGAQVACRIYDDRPSPCRELEPAWAGGRPSPQCDRARVAHGLPPLTPEWVGAMHAPGALVGAVADPLAMNAMLPDCLGLADPGSDSSPCHV